MKVVPPLGDENAHYWLVQRMARATCTDLVAARSENRLTEQSWADMVQHCRGCQWACGCQDWLEKLDPVGRDTPKTCANYETFETLRQGQKEARS